MTPFARFRIGLTAVVAVAIWSLLAWQHFHGGINVHHLLANPELPRVSDAIGGVLLPVLTWVLLGFAKPRARIEPGGLRPILVGLLAGLAYGAAMAVTFSTGLESITSYLFFGLLPLALILPVYRPECLLGFVMGMTFTFGAVLPTLFGSVMAAATYLVHRFLGAPLRRRLRRDEGAR